MNIEVTQKVETEKTPCGDCCRQGMNTNFDVTSFDSEHLQTWQLNKGNEFNTACCCNGALVKGFSWVQSNAHQYFRGYHGKTGACIENQIDIMGLFWPHKGGGY